MEVLKAGIHAAIVDSLPKSLEPGWRDLAWCEYPRRQRPSSASVLKHPWPAAQKVTMCIGSNCQSHIRL